MNILTATDSSVDRPLAARCRETEESVIISLGEDLIEFQKERIGGRVEIKGTARRLTEQILEER